jgi:hypothetical protein
VGKVLGVSDPDRLLERLEELWRAARRSGGARRVELYARSSRRLRARAEGVGLTGVEEGEDSGLAVRVVDGTGRIGFGAASGIDSQAFECALSGATGCPGPVIDQPWPTGADEVSTDLDAPVPMPEAAELESWLAAAGGGAGPRGSAAWVEFGRTVEALVADGGLRAVRQRHRAWGMRLVSLAAGDAIEERPRVVAARRLEDLPVDDLQIELPPSGPPLDLREEAGRLPLVIRPPAASVLVRALVGVLCGPSRSGRVPVGPAFAVTEDPLHPEALTGGRFDDAGFATRESVLVDGRLASAAARGAGHYLRESYRDPPHPSFGTLVLPDGGADPPPRAVRIEHLRIHAPERERWLIEVGGAVEEGGSPVRPLKIAFARVRPADLALRVQETIGKSRPCANGVITPMLLLDGGFGE